MNILKLCNFPLCLLETLLKEQHQITLLFVLLRLVLVARFLGSFGFQLILLLQLLFQGFDFSGEFFDQLLAEVGSSG